MERKKGAVGTEELLSERRVACQDGYEGNHRLAPEHVAPHN
jgi:hypothetical protein